MTLLFYAVTQWGHHVRRANDSPDTLLALAIEYLYSGLANNPEHLRLIYKVMYTRYAYVLEHEINVLHIAAFFGSSGIMSHLNSTDQTNLDSTYMYGCTPLSRAARSGHEAVVKLLQSFIRETRSIQRLASRHLAYLLTTQRLS
jgi:hypothetical protein